MLHLLEPYDASPASRGALALALEAHLGAVVASKSRGDGTQIGRAEKDVKAHPSRAIRFDETGFATVQADGRTFRGGRFETPRLDALRERARAKRAGAGAPPARLRLWVLDGASPATDIGALQATAAPGSLFQVASQFNCLEAPGPFVVEVADYLHDPTQGPRASISAFPGTLVRHYAAPRPDGTRFVQSTDGRQIDLLSGVCEPGVATVRSGYLRASDVTDPRAFARALEERFDRIRVGVHDGVEVVLGYDWVGGVEGAPERTIAQVFTSTLAAGMYSNLDPADPAAATIVRQLQRAAYLGTLLAAASLGASRVGLTLIGGGVFANPIGAIWDAILWAVDEVAPLLHGDLLVAVNGRNLGQEMPAAALRKAAQARGGALLRFDRGGATLVDE